MSSRFGTAPANPFASLLDQLGQSLDTSAASTAPTLASDGASAATPVLGQAPPTPTPVPALPVPAAAALQAAAALGAPEPQPQTSGSATSPKQTAKKVPPGALQDADTPCVPTPALQLPPPPAGPTPIPVAVPATTLTSDRASRTAVQAGPGSHAGLSVHDDDGYGVEPPPQPTGAPREAAAESQPGAIPSAPIAAPLPQPAGMANPAPADAPGASIRGRALPSARTIEPGSPSQPSSPFSSAASLLQQSPAPAPDVPALPPTPSPTTAVIASAPTASTRLAQAAPPPPSPATQVAQAIVEPVKVVLTSPAQSGPTTPHVTTIQITPAELGRVDIRIERTSDGPARIQLVAERPETLSRLVHDQSQLQQALDHVGISQDRRTLEFSLAPATTNAGAVPSGLLGNNTSGGESSGNGSQRGTPSFYNQAASESEEGNLVPLTRSQHVRTGVDITA